MASALRCQRRAQLRARLIGLGDISSPEATGTPRNLGLSFSATVHPRDNTSPQRFSSVFLAKSEHHA
jgi:hypothetical protein